MIRHPKEISTANGEVGTLFCARSRASDLAVKYNLAVEGPDLEFRNFGALSSLPKSNPVPVITYLRSSSYSRALANITGIAIITTKHLAKKIPEGNTRLITEDHPEEMFYTIFSDFVHNGQYEHLETYTSKTARVAPSAHIEANVYIDDNAHISTGAVVMSNTYIGRGVSVGPNSTIGGSFEPRTRNGRRWLVPHAGGVWLNEGVEIGANTCVDRAVFGDFTQLGSFTKIHNLISIAHCVVTGRNCCVIACSEISGSTVLGDGVWVGPGVSINQLLSIGNHAYVGTGAVVTRDLPPHALAYGSPAKVKAWACTCRAKLSFHNGVACCGNCNLQYRESPNGILLITERE